jgi:hypothetical protein
MRLLLVKLVIKLGRTVPVPIFVMCDERGGSTAFVEMLSKNLKNSCIIWEPFHPKLGVLSKITSHARPFIDLNQEKNQKSKKYYNIFLNLVKGENLNTWTSAYAKILDFYNPNYLIIKSVR